MEQDGSRIGQDTDDVHDGDGQDQRQHGIRRSIRPGTIAPLTVLVADMGDGSLFLEGWRDGPSAYLSPPDALPLRRELIRAFDSTVLPPSGEPDEAV
ncbi:MAG: hypothetical protein ACT4NP_12920 [Pseudonocardiales bacterium]